MNSGNRLASYRHIAFDFDGTIARLAMDWDAVRADTAVAFSLDASDIGEARRQFHRALETGGASARALYARILKAHEDLATITPGPAIALVARSDGFFVISDNLHGTVARGLTQLGLESKCLGIVGFDDVARSKPNTDAWELLVGRHGLGKPALYVGDRERDRLFATACGLDFLGVGEL